MTTLRSVAVVADVHGVLCALDAVLAQECVCAADRIVALGDIAAGPQPNQVMSRLLALGDRVCWVIGNADREMLELRGGARDNIADPVSNWAAWELSDAHLAALARHPSTARMDIEGMGDALFCHATPRRDDEVVLVDSSYARWDEAFGGLATETRTVVLGHTHMQFARPWRGRVVVNPGSGGMPYGRPGPHWAMLGPDIRLMRLDMDPDEVWRSLGSGSAYPRIAQWADRWVRAPATDDEAMTAFGLQDERVA